MKRKKIKIIKHAVLNYTIGDEYIPKTALDPEELVSRDKKKMFYSQHVLNFNTHIYTENIVFCLSIIIGSQIVLEPSKWSPHLGVRPFAEGVMFLR